MNKTLRNVTITGTGSYVPKAVRKNEWFERVGSTDAWIQKTLGIKERRIAAEDEVTSDLATKAGMNAIIDAGLTANDIDLIIVATATPDRPAPSTACFVQEKLKAYNAAAFDMLAVCAGFMFGMSIGTQYVSTGMFNNVLVIGADTFSKITDWERRDCVFFGDGAGAVVLSHTKSENKFLGYKMASDGRGAEGFTIPAGGTEIPYSSDSVKKRLQYWHMDGAAVYKSATTVVPKIIKDILEETNLTPDDIDIIVPHQPGKGMLKTIIEKSGLDWNKTQTNMDKYANTVAGTVPIMLDETNKSGKLKKGDTILLAAIGAGWTWSSAILKWDK